MSVRDTLIHEMTVLVLSSAFGYWGSQSFSRIIRYIWTISVPGFFSVLDKVFLSFFLVYMDNEGSCSKFILNDDMEQDDLYVVFSDNWGGQNTSPERIPAECHVRFNLGDRLAMVRVREFHCEEWARAPSLDIYDDCEGRNGPVLVSLFVLVVSTNRMQGKIQRISKRR